MPDFESSTYSLEHILPANPGKGWSHVEEGKQEGLIYRLGNMTPIETTQNRAVGNGDYAKKRAVYAESTFQITRSVAEYYENWDAREIEARQQQLAKVATGIWRIDFGD